MTEAIVVDMNPSAVVEIGGGTMAETDTETWRGRGTVPGNEIENDAGKTETEEEATTDSPSARDALHRLHPARALLLLLPPAHARNLVLHLLKT